MFLKSFLETFSKRIAPVLAIAAFIAFANGKAMEAASPNQPDAIVSGIVYHDGSPLSGASVTVGWNGGSQEITTGLGGTYSVSGVPTGGHVNIMAKPPAGQQFATHSWMTDNLAGDQVKDFDLEDGYRLTGSLLSPDGSPYTGVSPSIIPIDLLLPDGEFFGLTMEPGGQIDLILPPAHYALIEQPEFKPYFLPHQIIDLTAGNVSNAVFQLQHHTPLLPADPPKAALIQVGDPDVEGYANVVGAPGAVHPSSAVIVVNVNSRNLAITVSDTAGAFSLQLYAPPGSSLLVKYDPKGNQVASAWERSRRDSPGDALLNNLPGAILRAGAPPAPNPERQAFNSVGSWYQEVSTPVRLAEDQVSQPQSKWAGWWISGTLEAPAATAMDSLAAQTWSSLAAQPGQTITLTAQLRATSPAWNCTEPLSYTPTIEPSFLVAFGADGRADYWGAWFTSYLFTPTGLPIERESSGNRWSLGKVFFTNLACISQHTLSASVTTSLLLPSDLPGGIYIPHATLGHGGLPLSPTPILPVWYDYITAAMPLVRVGDPAIPRIPWSLLDEYPANGQRGVTAREDQGYFEVPNRTITPPHQLVIPRLDERTGQPVSYRLEPGSNWISSTDRRQPNPPAIPFALPSGEIMIEVIRPDGGVDQIGPKPVQQSLVRTPTTPGGALLDTGTGYIGDRYSLTTLDNSLFYTFPEDGQYTILLTGNVNDIYGNTYPIQGTYDVYVSRILDLDPAELPTTPYQQGDAFAPGLHIYPPVPAQVSVKLVQIPNSDPDQAITNVISGQANRFGYFQPPAGDEIRLQMPGEFRVDITAVFTDTDGALWRGAMTWGNVVEGVNPKIEAHGKRGMDGVAYRLPWFRVEDLPPDGLGMHVNYPYFSGDIHWGGIAPGDSIQAYINIKDTTASGEIYDLARYYSPRSFGIPSDKLEEMIAIDELTTFTPGDENLDPGVSPDVIEFLSYWYGSSQRPDVRVRELISVGGMPTAYWRFDDTYGYQIGEPADGDQPGDIKWEFGGAVLRVLTDTNPINEYAIYSSQWVLLPDACDSFGCARVSPPFQDATGVSFNGGPILTIDGQDIDMLFLPKGVRPGDILEFGNTVSFSGHVGPPLDSRVDVTITSPTGVQRTRSWHANKIGWLYDPTFDFVANEVGRWTVDVFVEHDRPLAYAGTPTSHNTGTVMGTSGQYEFYVVGTESPRLRLTAPQAGVITWPNWEIEPVIIHGTTPAGVTGVYYTIHDKGIVMGQGMIIPDPTGAFTLTYDAEALHETFSMLSLTAREGIWEGLADEVQISFLELTPNGPFATTVTLIGEQVFVYNDPIEEKRVYLPLAIK